MQTSIRPKAPGSPIKDRRHVWLSMHRSICAGRKVRRGNCPPWQGARARRRLLRRLEALWQSSGRNRPCRRSDESVSGRNRRGRAQGRRSSRQRNAGISATSAEKPGRIELSCAALHAPPQRGGANAPKPAPRNIISRSASEGWPHTLSIYSAHPISPFQNQLTESEELLTYATAALKPNLGRFRHNIDRPIYISNNLWYFYQTAACRIKILANENII